MSFDDDWPGLPTQPPTIITPKRADDGLIQWVVDTYAGDPHDLTGFESEHRSMLDAQVNAKSNTRRLA